MSVTRITFFFFLRAKKILSDITQMVKEKFSFDKDPFMLELEGIGCFSTNVVFVKIKDTPALDKLDEIAGKGSSI